MKKVALTGGPSGGKSTALRYLQAEHSNVLITAPEAATLILSGGFPTPNESHPWTQEWQTRFQRVIAVTQIALEETFLTRAENSGSKVLVCDRGLADGAAYLPGGLRELGAMIGRSPEEIIKRYDAVIHLPTSAKQSIGYQKHTNEHRWEEAEEAIALDAKVLAAWEDHPNRHIIDIDDFTQRNQRIAEIILSLAVEL